MECRFMEIRELRVEVTEECIALGGHSLFSNPVALAITQARALAVGADALIGVARGPSVALIADIRTDPASYTLLTMWHALLDGVDVPLPRRAQIFCDVWGYGPKGGPYKVGKRGTETIRRTYCEIIVPFIFGLKWQQRDRSKHAGAGLHPSRD